jgi:hypothetical protein
VIPKSVSASSLKTLENKGYHMRVAGRLAGVLAGVLAGSPTLNHSRFQKVENAI